MKVLNQYECDYCGKVFSSASYCQLCEAQHEAKENGRKLCTDKITLKNGQEVIVAWEEDTEQEGL